MKTQNSLLKMLPVIMIIGLMSTSCKKSVSPASTDNNNTSITDADDSQAQLLDMTNNFYSADSSDAEDFNMEMNSDESVSGKGSVGYSVSYYPSQNVYPFTKTIDYGSGYTNTDGVTKKGKVIITYYDVSKPGGLFSKTIYDNFYVNNSNVQGYLFIYTVKRPGKGDGKRIYRHIVYKKITKSNGDYNEYASQHVWRIIAGENTPNPSDDVYEVSSGHGVGKESVGGIEVNNWRSDVDSRNPVIKPRDFRYSVKGTINVTLHLDRSRDGRVNARDLDEQLNYGNGSYDNKATLSISGGTPQNITLPLQFWPAHL